MQAAQVTLNHYRRDQRSMTAREVTGILSDWLTRVFGCWHTDMSRPFTRDGESYRACLDCGAHRKFDPTRWEMTGAYYYSVPRLSQ
ncbi:MAG TPA: hypothetical protein VF779_11105 [Pyrinomonadaceae bacterium]